MLSHAIDDAKLMDARIGDQFDIKPIKSRVWLYRWEDHEDPWQSESTTVINYGKIT